MMFRKYSFLVTLLIVMLMNITVFAADAVQIKNKYTGPYDPPYLTVYKTGNPNYYKYTNHHTVYIPANVNLVALARNGKGASFYTEDGAELSISWMFNIGPRPGLPGIIKLEDQYQQFLQNHPNVEFKKLGTDWYVGRYTDKGNIVFVKDFVGDTVVHGLCFVYPANMAAKYDKVCDVLDATFTPSWAR